MNLSFAQRLTKATEETLRKPSTRRQPIRKIQTQKRQTKEKQSDFKKHHSDIKDMLKELQGNKNPQKKHAPHRKQAKQQQTSSIKQMKVKPSFQSSTEKNHFFFTKKHPEKVNKNQSKSFFMEPQQHIEEIQGSFLRNIGYEKKNNKQEHNKIKLAKKQEISKKGIPNIGNTCYMYLSDNFRNAILQCLFHLPEFNLFFIENRDEEELNPNNKGVIAKYKNLYQSVMSKKKNVQISTLPLKKSVSKICSLFLDFQQEDAHEFLRQLLDSMHQDLNLITEKVPWKLLETNGKDRNIYSLAIQYWNYYKNIDDSYIYDCFCGQICSSVTCASCHYESITFQNFLDLSLPMVKGKNKLQHLIKAYFDAETLNDYYSCSVCRKSIKNSTKKSQLWKAPENLIIHLKRSQFGRKNNQKIQIPVRCLNMKQFMKYSNDKSTKSAMYSLQGVVLHRGVIDGGHYWSQVKDGPNWYTIDDEYVEGSRDLSDSFELEGSEHAYILFYRSLTN